jgi:hypothetical protein
MRKLILLAIGGAAAAYVMQSRAEQGVPSPVPAETGDAPAPSPPGPAPSAAATESATADTAETDAVSPEASGEPEDEAG